MKKEGLFGLVLTGGRSTRMGGDKGSISYHGKPQREHLFDLLNKFCNQVFTSCNAVQELPAQLNPIHDKFDFESPLNGILSAFEQHSHVAWLAVAVDMPFVNEPLLQFLISSRDTSKTATCFYDSEGKLPEPLLTLWEPVAFQLLSKFNQNEGISPREFLIANECKMLNYPDSHFHVNINRPEDFTRLKTQ